MEDRLVLAGPPHRQLTLMRARNVVEDWARKAARQAVEAALKHGYAVAGEDLKGLIRALRRLPKSHRARMVVISYRRLSYWMDWRGEKLGSPVLKAPPRNTSSECPECSAKLIETGHGIVRCPACGFQGRKARDVALRKIEKRGLDMLKTKTGDLRPPRALQIKDVAPNRCGEPSRSSGR